MIYTVKGFFKSRKMIPFRSPLSIFIYHWFVFFPMDVVVELFLLKPDWLSDSKWLVFKYPMNWLEVSFSKTFAATDIIDIGLLLLHSNLLSPLCIGDMHAVLKSSGKIPNSIDLLNMLVSDSVITSTLSFRSLGEIRSGPVALEVLIFKISLLTSHWSVANV